MYDRVLVPTDGSAGVEQAMDHAIGIAERCEATMHVLSVVQTPEFAMEIDEMEGILERLERAGEDAVDSAVERATAAGQDGVESAVRHGVPKEEILAYVTEAEIDVVVMATEGRTGTAREMVGSVTEAVVRSAPVPVLTVNTGSKE